MKANKMTNEQFALFIAEKITRNVMHHAGKKNAKDVIENADVLLNWLKSKEREKTKEQ